jgi:hypothetical protein
MNAAYYLLAVAAFQLLPFNSLTNVTIVALALLALKKVHGAAEASRPRRRRASFATSVCAQGVFPPALGIPHPVIQGVLYFARAAPAAERVAPAVRRALLFYSRFRARPEYEAASAGSPATGDSTTTTTANATADTGRCVGWHEPAREDAFDIDAHIVRHAVATRAELHALVERLAAASIRVDRDGCWELHFVNVAESEGMHACVCVVIFCRPVFCLCWGCKEKEETKGCVSAQD